MATIDYVFQRLKFLVSKSGYTGTISSSDFNLNFPAACVRYYLKLFGNQNEYQAGNPVPRIAYPETLKVSSSLSKFKSIPQILNVDVNGQIQKPVDLYFIDSMRHYVVGTGGTSIASLTGLAGGTGYTNGIYSNIQLTGGAGSGAKATITVVAGVVTSVILNSIGSGYSVGNTLTASIPAGSGFTINVGTLTQNSPTPIKRVEEQDLADILFSWVNFPTELFPIYVEYATYIQFYPLTLSTVQLAYLRAPVSPYWNYTLNGSISTLNTLVGGSGYTNNTYTNVALTGGVGTGAMATIVVSGNTVTTVTITSGGFTYKAGDVLSATLPGGTGFTVNVATITNARQVYNPTGSVDPEWSFYDIDEIIYLMMADMGIFLRDNETESFAQNNMKTGGIL